MIILASPAAIDVDWAPKLCLQQVRLWNGISGWMASKNEVNDQGGGLNWWNQRPRVHGHSWMKNDVLRSDYAWINISLVCKPIMWWETSQVLSS